MNIFILNIRSKDYQTNFTPNNGCSKADGVTVYIYATSTFVNIRHPLFYSRGLRNAFDQYQFQMLWIGLIIGYLPYEQAGEKQFTNNIFSMLTCI